MRRGIMGAIALIGLLLALALAFGPSEIERRINRRAPVEGPEPSARARALHETLFVVDLHDDALLWGRDLLERSDRAHSDLPRWREGRVGLQVLAAVTKTPTCLNFERNSASAPDMVTALVAMQRWPMRTWGSLYQRSEFIASRFDDTVERSAGAMRAVRSRSDLDRLVRDYHRGEPVVGVLLASEGLHPLEGEAANLQAMFDAGYRMLAPTHFFDNEVSGSAHGEEKGGLTPFGMQIIDRMQQLGIVIDLAHASPLTVDHVLDRVRQPIVVSHTGVKATCPGPRNLSDAHLERIASGGGVVGIGLFEGAVCDISPDGVARAMRHVADRVGVEHVALGSDWSGATEVQIDPPHLIHLTDALLRAGFSEGEVREIMGGNALRVLRTTLPD